MKSSVALLLSVSMIVAFAGDAVAEDALAALEQTYRKQAVACELFRDREHSQKLELKGRPVYKWADSQAKGRTGGVVFIWTWQGRPEAVGAIFSNPVQPDQRRISHEFHSLSRETLYPAKSKWAPSAGITVTPVPESPPVAETAVSRMAQMRAIARRFSANTLDHEGHRWEMRLLSRPLYRHTAESDEGTTDVGVFALVTSELTDPEVILLLEKVRVGDKETWGYALLRFSSFRTYVRYDNEPIWQSLPTEVDRNDDQTYRLLQQPLIAETWN